MKFICEKNALANAISVASRTVCQKSSIAALEGILLKAEDRLYLTGYNLETGITVQLDAEITSAGDCVMPARLFFDIIRKLPDDFVTVEVDDKYKVSIKGGVSSFTIMASSAEDFPDLPQLNEASAVRIPENALRELIGGTIFAVSENQARPIHTGCLVEVSDDTVTMVAVDGFRLALRKEKLEHPAGGIFSFVAPGTALNEVEKVCEDIDELLKITLGDRHILFEVGDTELICRRLEGEFLDYKNAIPRKNGIVLTVDTKAMTESLERVSVVISEKLKSPVRCLFGQDMVTFSARTTNGEAKDVCRLAGNGKELEIGFNNRYLSDALRYAPAETVRLELNTGISPAIIVPAGDGEENFLYMVLPVRLKA